MIFFIRSIFPNSRKLIKNISFTDLGWSLDNNVRMKNAIRTYFDIRSNDAKGTNFDRLINFCRGVNYRVSNIYLGRSAQSMDASQTFLPPASALQSNFQIPLFSDLILACKSIISPGLTGFLNLTLSAPAK